MTFKNKIESPLISIIVPSYNHGTFLEERLDSIYNQDFQDFEVILLDDASTDHSRDVLLQYKNNHKTSHCVFNDSNSGNTFEQWNKGISLARGKYIWIAESDDSCSFQFLSSCSKILSEDQDIALIYCQSKKMNDKGLVTGSWLDHTSEFKDKNFFLSDFIMNGNEFIEKFLIYKNVIPNASGVIFKKQRAIDLGGISTKPILKYNADWLFYIQLVSNHKVAFLHESLNYFRFHSQSVISKAVNLEDRISLIKIELATRKRILRFLKKRKPPNYNEVLVKNKEILNKLFKEKREILKSNGKILKSRLSIIQQYLNNFK